MAFRHQSPPFLLPVSAHTRAYPGPNGQADTSKNSSLLEVASVLNGLNFNVDEAEICNHCDGGPLKGSGTWRFTINRKGKKLDGAQVRPEANRLSPVVSCIGSAGPLLHPRGASVRQKISWEMHVVAFCLSFAGAEDRRRCATWRFCCRVCCLGVPSLHRATMFSPPPAPACVAVSFSAPSVRLRAGADPQADSLAFALFVATGTNSTLTGIPV